eukprot:3113166-Prymnesium_polylepis.1
MTGWNEHCQIGSTVNTIEVSLLTCRTEDCDGRTLSMWAITESKPSFARIACELRWGQSPTDRLRANQR